MSWVQEWISSSSCWKTQSFAVLLIVQCFGIYGCTHPSSKCPYTTEIVNENHNPFVLRDSLNNIMNLRLTCLRDLALTSELSSHYFLLTREENILKTYWLRFRILKLFRIRFLCSFKSKVKIIKVKKSAFP